MSELHLQPRCFRGVGVFDDVTELSGVSSSSHSFEPTNWVEGQIPAATEVFTHDRQCELWMLHKPGLGPQEHYAGLAMQEQERRQVELERQLHEDRRTFELNLFERSRQIEDANQAMQSKWQRVGLVVAAAAVLLALVQLVAAIGALTPDSVAGSRVPWLFPSARATAGPIVVPSAAATQIAIEEPSATLPEAAEPQPLEDTSE